jgi:hypothetical protein
MAMLYIEVEIPDHEDPEVDNDSWLHDCVKDLVLPIEYAGWQYEITLDKTFKV